MELSGVHVCSHGGSIEENGLNSIIPEDVYCPRFSCAIYLFLAERFLSVSPLMLLSLIQSPKWLSVQLCYIKTDSHI